MSGSLIRLFHANPETLFEKCHHFYPLPTKVNQFKPSSKTQSNKIADIVIFGDIHTPFLERFYNRTLINAGSVGSPYEMVRDDKINANNMETTQANYLIIEGSLNNQNYGEQLSYQFIRLPYDIDEELKDVADNVDPELYEKELRTGKYRLYEKYKDEIDIIAK